jgi:hypothetical protein
MALDRSVAIETVLNHLIAELRDALRVEDGEDVRLNVYGLREALEDCWVVYLPQRGLALRSSEVVVVSKLSGAVIYHGSAHDEG